MKRAVCKGCGLSIEPGQLRRGDHWHADCYSTIRDEIRGLARPALPKARRGLTPTQVFILQHAIAGPVVMTRGDRKGTRCGGYEEDTGAAVITAYSNPAYFLVSRGLLRPRNQPNYYDVTDAGRTALAEGER